MKKRIGNDISFVWHIYRKSGESQVPESFTGKEVEVRLISPLQRTVTIEDVSIATGVVTFVFRGKHQTTLGNYVAVLLENKGEDGMVTIDVVSAVTLVPHSYMEDDGDEGDVIEAEAVELESSISAGSGGGIEQQQADWAQTDDTAVDYIKNKPNLDVYCRKDADNTHSDSSDTYVKRVYHEQGALIQLDRLTVSGDSIKFYHSHRGEETKELSLQLDDVEKIKRTATSELDGLMSADDKQKLTDIEAVIPEQASSSNQLADKNFVNSSIATNTANYISDNGQPFQSLADLEAYSGVLTNNDYAFVVGVDSAGNTTYSRYKYSASTQQWALEYVLNNSSFTAEQWAAINSSITSGLVAKLSALPTNSELTTLLNGKANTSDLAEVAAGVATKQDKMPIAQVASGTTAINAAVNTYYEVAGEVGTMAITLPTPTDLTKVSMVVVHLTAGTTPNVVIVSTETIDYSAAYDISAGNEYEINCLYNGGKWIVADMEVV